jgi:hypothetical protein
MNMSNELIIAAELGDHAQVAALLAQGHNVNFQNDSGNTPLWRACAQGQLQVVELLLDRGAIVDLKDNWGNTPLLRACAQGNPEVVALLLRRAANPMLANRNGTTTIMKLLVDGRVRQQSQAGDVDILLMLLQAAPNLLLQRDGRHRHVMHKLLFHLHSGHAQVLAVPILQAFYDQGWLKQCAQSVDQSWRPLQPDEEAGMRLQSDEAERIQWCFEDRDGNGAIFWHPVSGALHAIVRANETPSNLVVEALRFNEEDLDLMLVDSQALSPSFYRVLTPEAQQRVQQFCMRMLPNQGTQLTTPQARRQANVAMAAVGFQPTSETSLLGHVRWSDHLQKMQIACRVMHNSQRVWQVDEDRGILLAVIQVACVMENNLGLRRGLLSFMVNTILSDLFPGTAWSVDYEGRSLSSTTQDRPMVSALMRHPSWHIQQSAALATKDNAAQHFMAVFRSAYASETKPQSIDMKEIDSELGRLYQMNPGAVAMQTPRDLTALIHQRAGRDRPRWGFFQKKTFFEKLSDQLSAQVQRLGQEGGINVTMDRGAL